MKSKLASYWGWGLIAALAVVILGCAAPQAEPGSAAPAVSSASPTAVPGPVAENGAPAGDLSVVDGVHVTRGGTLRIGSAPRPSQDPVETTSSPTLWHVNPAYSYLLKYDPLEEDRFQPTRYAKGDLALSWEIDDAFQTFTFHLRDDALFHNGQPFTATDAKFTFDLVRDPPEHITSIRRNVWEPIESTEAPDPHTFVIHTSQPWPSFMDNMVWGWNVIFSKEVWEIDGHMRDRALGTGPFKQVRYEEGVRADYEAFSDFYGEEAGLQLPLLDGVQYLMFASEEAQLGALIAGQIDMFAPAIYRIPRETAVRISERNPQLRALNSPMYIWQGMWLDSSKPPFDDIRVRQAVYMAVDKAAIAEHGPSSPGRASGPMFSGGYWAIPREELEAHPFYQPDMEARREEARRLLAEAGYPDGFTFSLGHNDGRDGEQFFLMVESDLRQIGLRADGLPGETTEMGMRRITDALMHGGGIVDDPDNILGWFFKSDGIRNWYAHSTPGFDEKFDEQSRETDQERRLQLVRELELMAINDAAVQFYYYSGRWTARHQSVRFLVDQDTLSPSNTDTNFNLATAWIDQAKR